MPSPIVPTDQPISGAPPTTGAPGVTQGPDKKYYKFPSTWDKKKIDGYFTKHNIKGSTTPPTQPTGGQQDSVPKPAATSESGKTYSSSGVSGMDWLLTNRGLFIPGMKPKEVSTSGRTIDAAAEAMPSVGGMVGGAKGKVPGAFLGGAAGEAARQITLRLAFNEGPTTSTKAAMNIAVEGTKQAGLEWIGKKTGEIFFDLLNRIPHVEIKDGLKFLPSETRPGGTVYRYVEDLLSNLAPSARTFEEFKAARNTEVLKRADDIAQGFSRFKGTSQEMGEMLQKAMQEGESSLEKGLEATRQNYIKKGASAKQADLWLSKTAAFKELNTSFKNELAKKIIATNKPELIAGWLTSGTKSANNEIQLLHDTLAELKPDMMGKVQNQIMRDTLQASLTGSKDPIVKGQIAKNFAGDKFKQELDKIGETKLKAIYGEDGYKRIEEFVKLTGNLGVNRQGSSVGRFMNLMFLVPFRAGIKLESLTKTGLMAFAFNRAAKIITSSEGMRLYEGYIKAAGQQSPRLLSMAVDEINKFNERSDAIYKQEMDDVKAQYEKEKQEKK